MNTIKQSVIVRLVLLEDPHVLENLRVNLDLLVVPDRVFTQEVKAKNVWRLQRDVFTAEGATTHGICLIFTLLVTCSKSENIDKVHCRGPLPVCHLFRLELFPVICPDAIDVIL